MSDPGRIAVASQVARVTFFEDRAEVVRRASARLAAGTWWLALDGVALTVDDSSVSAGATGEAARVTAARVVRRVRQLPVSTAAEIETLEADLVAARGRRVDAERALARATAAEGRLVAVFESWIRGVERVPRGGEAEAQSWRQAHDAAHAALGRTLDEIAAVRARLEQTQLDESRARTRLDLGRALEPRHEAAVEVQVHVIDDAGGEPAIELEVKYRTPSALWRPEHVARLTTDGNQHELSIRTSAAAWQRTGEDWRDVPCRFSTARPSQSASPPLLHDDVLGLQRRSEKAITVEAREQSVKLAGLGRGARQVDEMPGVDDGGEPLSFDAPRPVTIPSDGHPVRIELGERRVACTVDLVAYPELTVAPHLRATATLTGTTPLLAGPVSLARSSSIVGRGKIAFVAPGEPFEIGFGVDDGVRVRRRVDEKRDTGLTGSQKIARSVHLYVSNLGRETRKLQLVERVPVSEIGEVEIKVTALGGARLDGKDGFARFDIELAPGATQSLELAYRIDAGAKVRLDL